MNSYDYLGWGGSSYAEGAKKSTAGKPLRDDNFDKISTKSARDVRKQTHWLNVNGTDIPAMVSKATARTVGVRVSVQIESPSEKFNHQAEHFLELFHRIKAGELTNKHHWNSAVRAISDFDLLDGGVIVRHHYLSVWKIPYKYELVPVDMIDLSKGTGRKNDGDFTLNGLVYNEWNQITHIWLYTTDDKITSEKVSMKNISYYSDVWVSLGQQTAISKLSSILPKLDQIDQYSKAELDAAIEAAKSGAFLKSSAYNEIMNVLRDEISKVPGSKKEKIDASIDFAKPILDRLSSIGIKPYGLTPIPSEDSVEFDPRKRDGVFDSLNNNSEMKMGAAIGLSDITVYSKADKVNYSAIKYISETDGLSASIRFDNIAHKLLDEINARAIEAGVQAGFITERKAYWANKTAFEKFRYLRQIHIDIEPSKNATANKTNLELGIKTKAQIIEERDGVKFEDYLTKQTETLKLEIEEKLKIEQYEQELRKKMGLDDKTEIIEKEEENKQLKAQLETTHIASRTEEQQRVQKEKEEKLLLELEKLMSI